MRNLITILLLSLALAGGIHAQEVPDCNGVAVNENRTFCQHNGDVFEITALDAEYATAANEENVGENLGTTLHSNAARSVYRSINRFDVWPRTQSTADAELAAGDLSCAVLVVTRLAETGQSMAATAVAGTPHLRRVFQDTFERYESMARFNAYGNDDMAQERNFMSYFENLRTTSVPVVFALPADAVSMQTTRERYGFDFVGPSDFPILPETVNFEVSLKMDNVVENCD